MDPSVAETSDGPEDLAALTSRVAERLAVVRSRIESAGGSPRDVTVVAVTKGFGTTAVHAALTNGLVDIGENYADELVRKAEHVATANQFGVRWHFQGRLQTNKINRLVPHVASWDCIDSLEHSDALAKRCPSASVFVQVNVVGDPGRAGCRWEDVGRIVDGALARGLVVQGLLCVGPDPDRAPTPSAAVAASTAAFGRLRSTADALGLRGCSMGMSDDLEAAVRCGATHVRLGSALFGERSG